MSNYSVFSDDPISNGDPLGNTDNKENVANPNNPRAKGGTQRFHSETTHLRSQSNCNRGTLQIQIMQAKEAAARAQQAVTVQLQQEAAAQAWVENEQAANTEDLVRGSADWGTKRQYNHQAAPAGVNPDATMDFHDRVKEGFGMASPAFFASAPQFAASYSGASTAMSGLSNLEKDILIDSKAIINSKEFDIIRQAHQNGVAAEIKVTGKTVLYEPDFTYGQAMTLHGENGFLLGPGAFTAEGGVEHTVIWEVTRLKTQGTGSLGVDQTSGFTDQAQSTANKLAPLIEKK